jgi:probable phosphoglycerate mutase
MTSPLPRLFLVRHGETAWTQSRQHTGLTDIPLNQQGEDHAFQLGAALDRFEFVRVLTSPLQRAHKTCELAGFGDVAEMDADLVEWDYGRYEGLLTADIVRERPGWELFRDGCPDGETPENVANRADSFLSRIRDCPGDVLAFSSGHTIRMIAARWLGLPPVAGRYFSCRPASVGVLAFEHNCVDEPVIGMWNYVVHATSEPLIDQPATRKEE